MADGWDLHAVVRGGATANININNNTQDPSVPDLSSLAFDNDDYPLCYQAHTTNFSIQSLEEIYRGFDSQPQPMSPTSSSIPIPIPSLPGLRNQQQQTQSLLPPPPQIYRGSSVPSPNFDSQTLRSRGRKNQQKKMVSQMTHDELLADSWAWRKYGQKPIKGSPFPRNYYKCSTSKGCAARKQVEKSPSDPTIYVVSYTGDHTHPRPTHRNSLAGSTRNKFTGAIQQPVPGSNLSEASASAAVPNPSGSSSSPVSARSCSPTTTLMEGESEARTQLISETREGENEEDNADHEMEDSKNDDDNILIPNTVMGEDIVRGFEELRGFHSSSSW